MDYLRSGGTVAELIRYLRRVETALRPLSRCNQGERGKMRDLATVVRCELEKEGAVELEHRIHQAVNDQREASAECERLIEEVGDRVARAVRCIGLCAAMLVDGNDHLRSKMEGGRRSSFPPLNGRKQLVNRAERLKCAADPEFDSISACIEELNKSCWKLNSPFPRNDLPGTYGVVQSGSYAEFLAEFEQAKEAWDIDRLSVLLDSISSAKDRFQQAQRRSEGMDELSVDLVNWLYHRPGSCIRPLREKAGARLKNTPRLITAA